MPCLKQHCKPALVFLAAKQYYHFFGLALFLSLASIFIFFGSVHAAPPPASGETVHPSPAYETLIDVLEDDQARNQLISELKRLAQPAGLPEESAPPTSDKPVSVLPGIAFLHLPGASISAHLEKIATKTKQNLTGSWFVISRLLKGQDIPGIRLSSWFPALLNLLATAVTTFLAYALFRRFAHYGFKRLDSWVGKQPKNRKCKIIGIVGALIIDLAASISAALIGYIATITLSAAQAQISLFAIPFLTAFVAIEATQAIMRSVFSYQYDRLRKLPLESSSAQFWNRWAAVIISVAGYSLLLLVPFTQMLLTQAVGQLLSLVIMLALYVYAVYTIFSRRRQVRDSLIHQSELANTVVSGTLLRILAHIWHWLLFVYLSILFVVSQIEQQLALQYMMTATGKTVLILAATAFIFAFLTLFTQRGSYLPQNWRTAMPALEPRLNIYIVAFLRAARLVVILVSALLLLDAWKVFSLKGWLSSAPGQQVLAILIHVSVIIILAGIGWAILASMIEHRLGVTGSHRLPTEREKTLLLLFRNAAAITIATLTILVILSQIGIDIGPLIAGAGVVGLAIGFGAQKLVQDVITGIFIQLENGMNHNDVVEVAGLFGTVEKITIRSVVIRTMDGGYHLIPFSAIDRVSNHTRDYGYHYTEYTIAYKENIENVIEILKEAFDHLMQDETLAPEILEPISIPGITALNEYGFKVRVLIKTTAGNQWMIQRAFNRLVKEHFEAAGIELPYPQRVLHFSHDKEGHTTPLDIRNIGNNTPAPESGL